MIYLHFSRETEFLRAVARDVRSYSHDVFVKAARILQRERLVNEETLNRFNHFVESVQQIAQKEKSIEDLIDEAPAEFLGIGTTSSLFSKQRKREFIFFCDS